MNLKKMTVSSPSHEQHSKATSPDQEVCRSDHTVAPMNLEIERSERIIFEGPLCTLSDSYIIQLLGFDTPIYLNTSAFHNDSALLKAFQKCPGVEVSSGQSARQRDRINLSVFSVFQWNSRIHI